MVNGRAWVAIAVGLLLFVGPVHASGFLGVALRPGLTVADVHPDSPAEEAGFAVGDKVVAVDGVAVGDSASLTRAVQGVEVGERLEVKVLREGIERVLIAKIAERLPYRPDERGKRGTELPSDPPFFEIKQRGDALGFNYYKFTLIRIGDDIFALHVLPDPRFGSGQGITYRWYSTRDGSNRFTSMLTQKDDEGATPIHPVDIGSGETHIGYGIGTMSIGTTKLRWSSRNLDSGWLYFSNLNKSIWVYSKQFDSFSEFADRLDGAGWTQMSVATSSPRD